MSGKRDNMKDGKTIAVIGQGNIGSQLLGHIGRMPMIRRVICVDPDVYTPGNLESQSITATDVGLAKAQAAARRLRDIRPGLEVTAIVDRVENVPWGALRADVICGCVDSKATRASINRIARRLGQAYVDAGIRADGLMARVDVYAPSPEGACIECAWGEKDYESLGQSHSCAGEIREAPSSKPGSALGGLAASIQAIECGKLLESGGQRSPASRQIVIEAVCGHLYVNIPRRNPACRFDHREWPIRQAAATTLGELAAAGAAMIEETPAALAVEARSWVTRLACRGCGQQSPVLRLDGRISRRLRQCRLCGAERQPVGFHMLPRLDLATARPAWLKQPLTRLGLRAGDVVRLSGAHREQCVELAVNPTEMRG
jgi:molybdopterin/thiamine biosynthesis adenylyltransferase